jgi:hypothetical protein
VVERSLSGSPRATFLTRQQAARRVDPAEGAYAETNELTVGKFQRKETVSRAA